MSRLKEILMSPHIHCRTCQNSRDRPQENSAKSDITSLSTIINFTNSKYCLAEQGLALVLGTTMSELDQLSNYLTSLRVALGHNVCTRPSQNATLEKKLFS